MAVGSARAATGAYPYLAAPHLADPLPHLEGALLLCASAEERLCVLRRGDAAMRQCLVLPPRWTAPPPSRTHIHSMQNVRILTYV